MPVTHDQGHVEHDGARFFACNMDPSGAKEFVFTPTIGRCLNRHKQDYARLSATPDQFDDFSEVVGLMQRTQPNCSAHDLAQISVPVPIVHSEHDEFIKREHAEYLARNIPQAEFIELAGVSHFAPLQRPEQFNTAMLAFLGKTLTALKNNEFGLADKMNNAPKYVVSTTLEKADWNNTQKIIKENIIEEIRKIKQEPGDYILTPGSATLVQSLMAAGLVDEYRFLVHSVIMGSGKRFFKAGMPTTKMTLLKTEPIGLGVSALYYQPL